MTNYVVVAFYTNVYLDYQAFFCGAVFDICFFLQAWSAISKLTEEKASALQENQKLRQELVLIMLMRLQNNNDFLSLIILICSSLFGTWQ